MLTKINSFKIKYFKNRLFNKHNNHNKNNKYVKDSNKLIYQHIKLSKL